MLDVICWNGSKGASLGFDADAELCERITNETGIPATTSILALDRVLREPARSHRPGLAARRRLSGQVIVAEFAKRGYPCVAEAHAGFSDNFSYCTVPDADIVAMIRKVAAAKPDAIVTFCTNFPAAHLVAPMEQETGIPIYDTISIGVWDALRRRGSRPPRRALGEPVCRDMKTLIRNAHVLTLDAEDREYPRADILVEGDRITAIGPSLQGDGATVIEAAGKLAMPGLINGHFHSQVACCGRAREPSARMFMLFEVPPAACGGGPAPGLSHDHARRDGDAEVRRHRGA